MRAAEVARADKLSVSTVSLSPVTADISLGPQRQT